MKGQFRIANSNFSLSKGQISSEYSRLSLWKYKIPLIFKQFGGQCSSYRLKINLLFKVLRVFCVFGGFSKKRRHFKPSLEKILQPPPPLEPKSLATPGHIAEAPKLGRFRGYRE